MEEIAELLNCGTQKAVKLMKELDDNQGIGLIEKKRLGLGKPNVIYVKNFILKEKCSPEQRGKAPENLGNTQNSENHNSRIVKTTNQELPESQLKKFQIHNLIILILIILILMRLILMRLILSNPIYLHLQVKCALWEKM